MAHIFSTMELCSSRNSHLADMVLLFPWKRTGSVLEKETSKCSIGVTRMGGDVSMVTPLEEAVIRLPDAVMASTVM